MNSTIRTFAQQPPEYAHRQHPWRHGPFIEASLVGREQVRNGVFPGQFFIYPLTAHLPHPVSLGGVFQQPQNLGRKIGHLVAIVGIDAKRHRR